MPNKMIDTSVLLASAPVIIIRTPHGEPLRETELKSVLRMAKLPEDLASDRILYRAIMTEDRYQLSYQRRLEIGFRSTKLLLDTLSPIEVKKPFTNEGDLRQHINDIREKYLDQLSHVTDKSNVDAYQEIFDKYLRQMQYAVCKGTGIPAKEFREGLAKAEEYATLEFGRPILATVIPQDNISPAGKKTNSGALVQMEIPQKPIDHIIGNDSIPRGMAQEYVSAAISYQKGKEIFAPEWFKILSDKEKKLFWHTFSDISGIKGEPKYNNIYDINAVKYVEEKCVALSSKHRTIPGVANFSLHRTAMLNADSGVAVEFKDRYRSSKFASRDVKDKDHSIRYLHAKHNFDQIVNLTLQQKLASGEITLEQLRNGEIPILMQTLITPFFLKKVDYEVFKDKAEIINYYRNNPFELIVDNHYIKINLNIIDTNHPLNVGRYLQGTTAETDLSILKIDANQSAKEGQKLIEQARRYIAKKRLDPNFNISENDNLKLLKNASDDLEKLINNSMLGTLISDNQRELFLASLEQIIVSHMNGVAYGSCISGKDRKGLETIHTDAMELYYHRYGKLPPYDTSPEREKFVDIFVEIYASRHQQINAGQNALGADGIKQPAGYLPADIQKAIQINHDLKNPINHSQHVLKDSDRLASNNELNKILAKKSLTQKASGFVTGKNPADDITFHLSDRDIKMFDHDIKNTITSQGHSNAIASSSDIMELLKKSPHKDDMQATIKKDASTKQNILSQMHCVIHCSSLDKSARFKLIARSSEGVNSLRQELPKNTTSIKNETTLNQVLATVQKITEDRLREDPSHRDPKVHLIYKLLNQISADLRDSNAPIKPSTVENIAELNRLAAEVRDNSAGTLPAEKSGIIETASNWLRGIKAH